MPSLEAEVHWVTTGQMANKKTLFQLSQKFSHKQVEIENWLIKTNF